MEKKKKNTYVHRIQKPFLYNYLHENVYIVYSVHKISGENKQNAIRYKKILYLKLCILNDFWFNSDLSATNIVIESIILNRKWFILEIKTHLWLSYRKGWLNDFLSKFVMLCTACTYMYSIYFIYPCMHCAAIC